MCPTTDSHIGTGAHPQSQQYLEGDFREVGLRMGMKHQARTQE